MKALSLTQPMAWAIFHGKDVENRPWNTYYRGPLLIHASKGFNQEHYDWIAANENRLVCVLPQTYELVHGALIGTVNLVRVMKMAGNTEPMLGHSVSIGDTQRELEYLHRADSACCSRWFSGPYGFVLEGAREFSEPIPYRGSLGLFDVPDDLLPTEVRISGG